MENRIDDEIRQGLQGIIDARVSISPKIYSKKKLKEMGVKMEINHSAWRKIARLVTIEGYKELVYEAMKNQCTVLLNDRQDFINKLIKIWHEENTVSEDG